MGQDGPGWIVGSSGASQPQQVIEKQAAAPRKKMLNYERPLYFGPLRVVAASILWAWLVVDHV